MVVSMTMLPKLLHIDYAFAARKPKCNLGPLATADHSLFGDDAAGRKRVALPARKGDPIALLVPYVDLMKAIAASKEGRSASADGYVLAVIDPSSFTGWRYYTGMPDSAVLKRDMADALAGRGQALFRTGADGQTTIMVPGG